MRIHSAVSSLLGDRLADRNRHPGRRRRDPFLADASSHVAAQATITVSGGAFSSALPARSLVTFQIQTTNRR
jgi:hypothetical protein